MSLTVHLVLVFHVFIAVIVMVMVCSHRGIGEADVCVCRCHYGACEIPSVASLIGGVAAQEVIKVITGQFIPLNNTFIYNAIKQTSVSLEL